jgi:hypothetical protein
MLEDNVDEIKSLSLYFDQINIIEQRHLHIVAPVNAKPDKQGKIKAEVVSTNDFTDNKFILHLKEFEREKIINYKIDIDGYNSPEKGLHSVSTDMQINDLVLWHTDLVGKKYNEKQTSDEKGRIFLTFDLELNKESEHLSKNLFKNDNSTDRLLSYYAKVFKTFVNYYEKGNNVLTSSKYINDIFQILCTTDRFKETQLRFKNEFKVNPSLVFEAIKLGVPDLGKFPPEEILKFKENSKSELQEFQVTLENMSFDLLNNYDQAYIYNNAQKIADIKIKPLINNISRTLESSKSSFVRELIKEAKDPKSYAPLLLTFSDKISQSMILLISTGLIGLNAGLEHYSKIKEAKNDGVYYLYKMKKYFA